MRVNGSPQQPTTVSSCRLDQAHRGAAGRRQSASLHRPRVRLHCRLGPRFPPVSASQRTRAARGRASRRCWWQASRRARSWPAAPQVVPGPCSRGLSMCDRLRSQRSPNELAGLRGCCARQGARTLDERHCLVSNSVHQYHRINGASECTLEACPLNHTRSPFSQAPRGPKLGSCFPLHDLRETSLDLAYRLKCAST